MTHHKRKLTLDCPLCFAGDEVVADPRTKKWICFNCRHTGIYTLILTPDEDDPPGTTKADPKVAAALETRAAAELEAHKGRAEDA